MDFLYTLYQKVSKSVTYKYTTDIFLTNRLFQVRSIFVLSCMVFPCCMWLKPAVPQMATAGKKLLCPLVVSGKKEALSLTFGSVTLRSPLPSRRCTAAMASSFRRSSPVGPPIDRSSPWPPISSRCAWAAFRAVERRDRITNVIMFA